MKQVTGFLIAVLGLAFIAVLILRIWHITVISWGNMLRSGATLFLLAAAILLLVLVRLLFFRPQPK